MAAAIWDLYDSNEEATWDFYNTNLMDDVGDKTFTEINYVFTTHEPVNFNSFYDNWQQQYRNTKNADKVMTLHSMSFAPALPVTPTNTTPVATSHSTVSVSHNTATSITLRGADADGDSLDFFITSNTSKGILSHTSTTKAIPGDNGSSVPITYTPRSGQTGTDTFSFKVNDGTVDSTSRTVRISIANAPVVVTPTSGGSIFSDDFEGTLSQWTLTGDNNELWEIITVSGDDVASAVTCNDKCIMISDTISGSGATQPSFDRYLAKQVDRGEGLKIYISTNNGVSDLVCYLDDI